RAQTYDGQPIRVSVDRRDLRGGEKVWQYIKKGVPLRAEIGPRDMEGDSCFVGRRDQSPRDKQSVPRQQFVATAADTLTEIQDNLFQRACRFREEHSVHIDSLDDFQAYFTPQNSEKPEIHGGLAWCHCAEDPQTTALLQKLKVTVRCIPLDGEAEAGKCIVSGRPTDRRVVLAKAY
ncbi:MAG: His/Gly/Thr/Pro-type tRNA ligase C-terminal domain-containing protein, partial [Planctomycetota bacterium]|nr:His/Gly/Thr/Pro-type tRNA ligase C-terminal domain-containing protein [Planctomycetota bacterium]